ncbi:MAG: hypothetical protein LBJ11_09015 [Oscillospiraceae bacterium]|jgi:hypothetical protein|nr:hypothetical protein [Oscillospiraceae bacterium]
MPRNTKCEDWLWKRLHGKGWVDCGRVRREAQEQGFSKSGMKAARKNLGISTCHEDLASGETWYWRADPV